MKFLLFSSILILLFVQDFVCQTNEKGNIRNNNEIWKFKTGGKIYAAPVIMDKTLCVGSLDSIFYAINTENGKDKWKYKTDNPIHSTAAIGKNAIYFESGNMLYALNLEGELIWVFDLYSKKTNNQIDAWDFHHSSPAISKGVIYIGTEQGLVYGIEAKTGKQVFKCQTENKETIRTTPAIKNETIYFGDWDGIMYAYNTKSGKKMWQYNTKDDKTYRWRNAIQTSPVVADDKIYFAGRNSCLYCLNAKTGEKVWAERSPTDQWLVGGPKIADGLIFIGSSDQHIFQAFDAKTGKLAWKTDVDCRIWGTAWVDKETVYIGSNSMYAFDKQSGNMLSAIKFEKANADRQLGSYIDRTANIHSSPIASNSVLFFGSDDGFIYAIKID